MAEDYRYHPNIRMENAQAFSFAAIHPIECGMYFFRVKQLKQWMETWDTLQDINGNKRGVIGCTMPVSSLSDCAGFMESLMAHIFDGGRTLELVIESQMFEIRKLYGEDGDGFRVHHFIHNSHNWICQGRNGYIFPKMHVFQFLKILHERVHSDNWGDFDSIYVNN